MAQYSEELNEWFYTDQEEAEMQFKDDVESYMDHCTEENKIPTLEECCDWVGGDVIDEGQDYIEDQIAEWHKSKRPE